jgi:hypothetical protein
MASRERRRLRWVAGKREASSARARSAGSGWVSIRERILLVPNRGFCPMGARWPVCAFLPSLGGRTGCSDWGKPLQVPAANQVQSGGKPVFSLIDTPALPSPGRAGVKGGAALCRTGPCACRAEIGLDSALPHPEAASVLAFFLPVLAKCDPGHAAARGYGVAVPGRGTRGQRFGSVWHDWCL